MRTYDLADCLIITTICIDFLLLILCRYMNRFFVFMLMWLSICSAPIFAQDLGFSYKWSIVFDYKEQFEYNNYFPSLDNNNAFINPEYPSVYLTVNQVDLPYLLAERNETKSIKVSWYVEETRWVDGRSEGQKDFFENEDMTLRGSMSLSCGKPSFSIDWINLKLKGMCGSDFWVEEQVFSQGLINAVENISWSHIALYAPHTLINVFVNDRFYGVYTRVPNFNKEYLTFNWYDDVSQKNSCILKVYKLFTHELNPYNSPILTTLETIWKYDMQDVELLADVKYGRNNCYSQLENLIHYLNSKPLGSVSDMIDKESVLYRWLTNWVSQTLLSYEHNYILAVHHWRYAMWFWDNEAFHWCVDAHYTGYREQPHQNLLFSHVLRWYENNNPSFIDKTIQSIQKDLCDPVLYQTIKEKDLPYILYDRYLWNAGHFTVLDFRDRSYNTLLYDVFYKRINFPDYKEKMLKAFDDYFVSHL